MMSLGFAIFTPEQPPAPLVNTVTKHPIGAKRRWLSSHGKMNVNGISDAEAARLFAELAGVTGHSCREVKVTEVCDG